MFVQIYFQFKMFSLVLLASCFCAILLAWYYHLFRYRNCKLPGPKPLPILGNVHLFGTKLTDVFEAFENLTDRYGDKFKLFLGHKVNVVLTDPVYIQHFLNSNVHLNKSSLYEFYKVCFKNGLPFAPADIWKINRKLLSPGFHVQLLEHFTSTFNSASNSFVEDLKKSEGKSIDIYPKVNLLALDIICKTAMGVDINNNVKVHEEYAEALYKVMGIGIKRMFSFFKRSDFLFSFTQDYKEQEKSIELISKYTDRILNEYRNRRRDSLVKTSNMSEHDQKEYYAKKKMALLDLMLNLHEEGKMSLEQIKVEMDTFLFTGHDTSATALSFLIYELSKHRDVQEKIYEEIKSFETKTGDFTMQQLNEMKYLECAIKESLRLYTIAPFNERVTEVDVQIDDVFIPKGTNITFFSYKMHRSEKLYPNPLVYDPDRFLPENSIGRHPYAFIPFSAGPRNCIGMRYAMLEMKCILAKLISAFRLIESDPGFELKLENAALLKSVNGYPVVFKSR